MDGQAAGKKETDGLEQRPDENGSGLGGTANTQIKVCGIITRAGSCPVTARLAVRRDFGLRQSC